MSEQEAINKAKDFLYNLLIPEEKIQLINYFSKERTEDMPRIAPYPQSKIELFMIV